MFDLPFKLPAGWEVKTVEQLISDGVLEKPLDGNHGGTHPKAADYVESGVPFVMASDLGAGRVNLESCKFISEVQASKLRKGFSKVGDVLLSHKATIGRTAIVQNNKHEYIMLTPQITYYRVKDHTRLVNTYLKAFFDSRFFQIILGLWAGSGSTRAYLGITGQLKLPIIIPPISSQLSIADQVGSIDEKIELNRKTNQTLEQIAQAIFKSWFVDFEPTRAKIKAKQDWANNSDTAKAFQSTRAASEAGAGGNDDDAQALFIERAAMAAISGTTTTTNPDGLKTLDELPEATLQQLKTTAALFPDSLVDAELGEVPEGWELAKLSDLIEFNPRRTLKKGELAPYLDMKNIPTEGHLADDVYDRVMASGSKFVNGDTLLARITPCLENGKTAYVDFLEDDQVGWGSTEYIVMRSKHGRPLSLTYFIARLDSFRALAIQTMTGTSGRQRANANALGELDWLNFPTDLLNKFDLVSGGYLQQARANGDENKILAQLRDALLPKLLSGELPIPPNERV